jgi:hypothetical protein
MRSGTYPQIASDYVKTFALLKTTSVDLFLGAPTTAFAFISDNAGNAIELIEHKTQSTFVETYTRVR